MSASLRELRTLFPEITPFRTGKLRVSPVHELYFEESGNPEGKPVVFLHGGPGGGTDARQRRFFDPARYRIVLFDQRGCGKSTPYASLEDNTTPHLVEDIELLRRELSIERWQVFGGSWGSTLALAYAETYPAHVTELVLRGIFLLRKSEIDWFYQKGASALFPDAWEDFIAPVAPGDRHDLVSAYYKLLTESEPSTQLNAARAWSVWEGRTSCLLPNEELIRRTAGDVFALAFARIECHYFMHGGFFGGDDALLRGVERIRHIPATIVQGRYDVVCPAESAWALHRAWPEADLKLVADAGHSAFEPGNVHELVSATDRYAGRRHHAGAEGH